MVDQTCERYARQHAFTAVLPNGMFGNLSFAQVRRDADRFAAFLREELGLAAGDRVAIQLPNSLAYPICAFGVLKAGCVLVNTNPLYTPAEMIHQFNDSGARALVIVDLFGDKVAPVLERTGIEHVVLVRLTDRFPRLPGFMAYNVIKYWNRLIPRCTAPTIPFQEALSRGTRHLHERKIDVATTFSTLAAFVMAPLWIFIYGSRFMTSEISVGMSSVIVGLVVILIPVVIGMFIRRHNANVGALLELLGGILGVVIILALIALWVPRNAPLLATTPWQVYAAAVGVGVIGFFFGFLVSQGVGLGFRRAATVALETGIQNGPLALSIVLLSFQGDLANEIALIPVLYSLFIVITSSLVTVFFRRQNQLRQQYVGALL